MTQKILQVKDVEKSLLGNHILKKINFEVTRWEIYGFLWPNGAGKTTTMKCIMGLITPEKGSIEILWGSISDISIRAQIGFMPENTYLYKHLTGREFLRFNGNFFHIPPKLLEEKIESLLSQVWLTHAGNNYLHSYSKWMLQRIWLAQSIINDPKILFLDEPMSGLDPIGRKMVKNLLLDLKKKHTTIFFNTHILADVEEICDTFSIIHQGKIIVQNMKIKDLSSRLEDFFIEQVEK